MTDERQKELHDLGWDAYWDKKTIEDCPDLPLQEERDEWVIGWYSAQSADFVYPYDLYL
jgi:hypothetical protein